MDSGGEPIPTETLPVVINAGQGKRRNRVRFSRSAVAEDSSGGLRPARFQFPGGTWRIPGGEPMPSETMPIDMSAGCGWTRNRMAIFHSAVVEDSMAGPSPVRINQMQLELLKKT